MPGVESQNEAEIIDFIREVMARNLFLEYGASSMFDFLTRAHYHYANAVAQRKMDAACIMQLFPEVKAWITNGEIGLIQLGMLASGLRQKPADSKLQHEILEAIRGQTIDNTQAVLSEMLGLEVKKRAKIRVQRDGSVRAELTFSKEQWETLNQAKDVVSHSVPSGGWSEVLTYCASFTVSKKSGPVSPPQKAPPTSILEVRKVSRASRRFVFQRDKSCRYRHADGRLCESRYQLQVDHVTSRWAGGGNEVENLQILCGVHNRYKYEREMQASRPDVTEGYSG